MDSRDAASSDKQSGGSNQGASANEAGLSRGIIDDHSRTTRHSPLILISCTNDKSRIGHGLCSASVLESKVNLGCRWGSVLVHRAVRGRGSIAPS